MGVTFDRWLARPSTLCFLRRVIHSETGSTLRLGRRYEIRRHQSNATAVQVRYEPDDGARSARLYGHERRNSSRAALFLSLRHGFALLPTDVEAKDVSREIDIQVDVGAADRLGQLSIDDPENLHNMSMWAEILEMRQRLHGREGLEAVWKGLRMRNVDPPVEGPEADFLWSAFVHGGIANQESDENARRAQLLQEVFSHAKDMRKRIGKCYPALYKLIVGRWLHIAPRMARIWHGHLVKAGLATADDVKQIASDLMRPAGVALRNGQYKFFRQCYMETSARDMYDVFITEALRGGDQRKPLEYHQFFLSNGDAPSQAFFATPGVQNLFNLDCNRSLPMRSSRPTKTELQDIHRAAHQYAKANRESMNTLVGDVHGIKPKELSDVFCARMFATRAFSVHLVIKGLALFGADALGPLAMREMAVRSGSHQSFCDGLQQLEDLDISTGDSMLARLLTTVAKQGNDELWQALLESDQHPEAYDDAQTQSSLIAFHLEQRKWPSAHLSLIIASLAGAQSSEKAWNRVLQYYLLSQDYPATVGTFQSMQSQQVFITPYTMDLMNRHILPLRNASKRPMKGYGPGFFEPTAFVAKAYIYASERGAFARPNQWTEVLKRLGMNHQWEQFERVVMSLLQPSRPANDDEDHEAEVNQLRTNRLQAIFTSNMRKALFIWGFRSASIRNQLCGPYYEPEQPPPSDSPPPVERWAQGLPLVQRLRKEGFDFPILDIRTVFTQRMWILFGPGYSTRAINQEARRNNRLSLAHYIKHANEVWPGLVDWVEPRLLESESDARLLPAFFGEYYRASKKRFESADVRAWSEALGRGREFVIEPRKTRGRKAVWMRSPLRVVQRPVGKRRAGVEGVTKKPDDTTKGKKRESRVPAHEEAPQVEDKG